MKIIRFLFVFLPHVFSSWIGASFFILLPFRLQFYLSIEYAAENDSRGKATWSDSLPRSLSPHNYRSSNLNHSAMLNIVGMSLSAWIVYNSSIYYQNSKSCQLEWILEHGHLWTMNQVQKKSEFLSQQFVFINLSLG